MGGRDLQVASLCRAEVCNLQISAAPFFHYAEMKDGWDDCQRAALGPITTNTASRSDHVVAISHLSSAIFHSLTVARVRWMMMRTCG